MPPETSTTALGAESTTVTVRASLRAGISGNVLQPFPRALGQWRARMRLDHGLQSRARGRVVLHADLAIGDAKLRFRRFRTVRIFLQQRLERRQRKLVILG